MAVGPLRPDLVFLLDLPEEYLQERIPKGRDRIENFPNDFYYQARKGYLVMSKSNSNFIVLDARLKVYELHNIIKHEIRKLSLNK